MGMAAEARIHRQRMNRQTLASSDPGKTSKWVCDALKPRRATPVEQGRPKTGAGRVGIHRFRGRRRVEREE